MVKPKDNIFIMTKDNVFSWDWEWGNENPPYHFYLTLSCRSLVVKKERNTNKKYTDWKGRNTNF